MEKPPKKEKLEGVPKGLVDKNNKPISTADGNVEEGWSGKRPKEKKAKEKVEGKVEDSNEDFAKLKALKSKILELHEKYFSEAQREEKALLFSELQKTQQEYRDLEEKMDTAPKAPKMSEQEKKEKEVAELKNFLDLLNKARQGSVEHEDVYWHVFGKGSKTDAPYPKSLVNRADLLEKFAVGKNGEPYKDTRSASHDLMEFLANEAEDKLRELTKKKEEKPEPGTKEEEGTKTPEGEKKPVETKTPEIPPSPEDFGKLDDLRGDYLKAKRLRGNILRGGIGGFLRRKLNFGGEEMKFGGKKGEEELEKVRHAYQLELSRYRTQELSKLESTLGTADAAARDFAVKSKIIELLGQEQSNIDKRSVEGIEKNFWEKIKTKFRQGVWKRTGAGFGLAGLASLTAGTGVAAAAIGTRAVLGGAGMYLGAEAQLERLSAGIGHRSSFLSKTMEEVHKRGSMDITGKDVARYMATLPAEEIRKEATRLRMLQVEKGVAIDRLHTSGDNGSVASLIIERDNELTAEEVTKMVNTENQALKFANVFSMRLSRETNLRNELVEKEVDRERINKMKRKTLAALAGGAVGWLIGGSLFNHTEIPPVKIPVPPDTFHKVVSGENLWKIIGSDFKAHHITSGFSVGPEDHTIDAFKDVYEKMSSTELKHLGFSSGVVDKLVPGDVLNMSAIHDVGKIASVLSDTKHLSPAALKSIVENHTEIANWLAMHGKELTGPLNSSVIEEILKGTR